MSNRRTVLACIDGSAFSNAVADYAGWIARRVDAPVTLLHNIEHGHSAEVNLSGNLAPGDREALLEELAQLESRRNKILIEQGRRMLDAAYQRMLDSGAMKPALLQRHGSLMDSLIEMEEEIRVLVMGVRGETHGREVSALGGQLEPVIRTMQRPVLVVNRDFQRAPERLMIAYDGSEAAGKGLDMVTMSPLYRGMVCHLVQVGDNSTRDQAILAEGVATLRQAGLDVTGTNLTGDVDDALLQYQQNHDIDLIVMGAFGHSRLREILFGSNTLNILSHARIPLLLLR